MMTIGSCAMNFHIKRDTTVPEVPVSESDSEPSLRNWRRTLRCDAAGGRPPARLRVWACREIARLPNYRAGVLRQTFDPTPLKRLEGVTLNKPGQSESNQCS